MSSFEPHARAVGPQKDDRGAHGAHAHALGPAVDAETSALLDFTRFGLSKDGVCLPSSEQPRRGALVRRDLRFVNCGEMPFRVLDQAFDAGAVQLVVNEGRPGSPLELALLSQHVAKLVFYPPRPTTEGGVTGRGRVLVLCRKQGPPGFGQKAPSRLHQRHRVPGTAPRCGQPRPISLLGRFNAVRPCWPWFSPRCWSAPTTTGWLTRRTGWEAHSSRARTSPCCTTSSPVPWPRARDLACACRGMFEVGYTRVPRTRVSNDQEPPWASSMIARPQRRAGSRVGVFTPLLWPCPGSR